MNNNNVIYENVAELKRRCNEKIEFMLGLIGRDFRLDVYNSSVNSFKEFLKNEESGLTIVDQLVKYRKFNNKINAEMGKLVDDYISYSRYNELVTKGTYRFIGSCLGHLKISDAWRGKKGNIDGFKKLEKEALNAKIYFLLLIRRREKEGKDFDSNVIVAYILKRLITKSSFWDSKPENKKNLKEEINELDELIIDDAMERASKIVGNLFIAEINELASRISREEEHLFKQARTLATAIEFKQIKQNLFWQDIEPSEQLLNEEMAKYEVADICENKQIMDLFERMSWSRFTDRWQGYFFTVKCNILAHMLETAVFAWLMAIEMNNFAEAGDLFAIGLFHDLPEVWTDDVPSPCKDRIVTNSGLTLREVTDKMEVKAFDEYFYPCLCKETEVYYRKNIDLNGVKKEFHDMIKKADYFAADYEVWWNIVKGTRDKMLANVIYSSLKRTPRTPETHKVLEEFADNMKDIVFLEP
jgi:5'-deoxynucleotidase YfbR-like HD superfamily hydrolase